MQIFCCSLENVLFRNIYNHEKNTASMNRRNFLGSIAAGCAGLVYREKNRADYSSAQEAEKKTRNKKIERGGLHKFELPLFPDEKLMKEIDGVPYGYFKQITKFIPEEQLEFSGPPYRLIFRQNNKIRKNVPLPVKSLVDETLSIIQEEKALSLTSAQPQSLVIDTFRRFSMWIPYQNDYKLHLSPDYTQSPEQTLGLFQGDCQSKTILFNSVLSYFDITPHVIFTKGHVLSGVTYEEAPVPVQTIVNKYDTEAYTFNGKKIIPIEVTTANGLLDYEVGSKDNIWGIHDGEQFLYIDKEQAAIEQSEVMIEDGQVLAEKAEEQVNL